MKGLDGELRLGSELSDQTAILNCIVLAHGAPDGNTLGINHYDAL